MTNGSPVPHGGTTHNLASLIDTDAVRNTTGEGELVLRYGKEGDTLMMFFAVEGVDGKAQHVALSIDLFETPQPQDMRARVSETFTPVPA